jgi:hypothetical protein
MLGFLPFFSFFEVLKGLNVLLAVKQLALEQSHFISGESKEVIQRTDLYIVVELHCLGRTIIALAIEQRQFVELFLLRHPNGFFVITVAVMAARTCGRSATATAAATTRGRIVALRLGYNVGSDSPHTVFVDHYIASAVAAATHCRLIG